MFCHGIVKGGDCKVVIYNYILYWLYSMTKSVVIALIFFFLYFVGFYYIGFSIKLVKNQWISQEAREKLTRERAT